MFNIFTLYDAPYKIVPSPPHRRWHHGPRPTRPRHPRYARPRYSVTSPARASPQAPRCQGRPSGGIEGVPRAQAGGESGQAIGRAAAQRRDRAGPLARLATPVRDAGGARKRRLRYPSVLRKVCTPRAGGGTLIDPVSHLAFAVGLPSKDACCPTTAVRSKLTSPASLRRAVSGTSAPTTRRRK
jgi:hypothetical protein